MACRGERFVQLDPARTAVFVVVSISQEIAVCRAQLSVRRVIHMIHYPKSPIPLIPPKPYSIPDPHINLRVL